MSERPTLVINEVWRRTQNGNVEALSLTAGVNLIVGQPNTGKTKWLETIDYLLGDAGPDPFSIASEDDPISEKYDAAGLHFAIAGETHAAERRWREAGGKGKIFVDDEQYSPKEFQQFLMTKLDLPVLAVPSGNPFSGRTWPELSFRTLLRHFYRQQRMWNNLVDKQPEDTFQSCVQYFLGLAEHLYTEDYERRVLLTNEINRLRTRRDQFADTLADIARDFLDEDPLTLSVTETSLNAAANALDEEYKIALQERETALQTALSSSEIDGQRSQIVGLTELRSELIEKLNSAQANYIKLGDRLEELQSYETALHDEAKRLKRADSAASILSDLKITHCPSCNQTVKGQSAQTDECFLCHQPLGDSEIPEELAKQRVDYERTRLAAELSEATELTAKAKSQTQDARKQIQRLETEIGDVERRLAPARQSLSALVEGSISALDNKLGAISERSKQLRRLTTIFSDKKEIEERLTVLEAELKPIYERGREISQGLDYSGRASWLENGMNDYLTAIKSLEPQSWPHQAVNLYLSASTATFRVGNRRWDVSLGGTASLYYFMAYHFGLLTLMDHKPTRMPGFSMIDFPADFAGTKIGDSEDFVVQPFIDLLAQEGYENCQLIITGASFSSLSGVNRIDLVEPYVS